MREDIISTIQARVESFIKRYNMIEPGQGIVIGVSGGSDSLALLHILWSLRDKLGIEAVVAHVEHGIRGQQSLDDARYVMEIARHMGLPVYVKHCDVPLYAREHGLSEEEAGRIIRYEFFGHVCEIRGCSKIAVAHNKNDNAETILFNILRGTGLDGLVGIKPVVGNIIRPMLDVSKADIEAYCTAAGLNARKDYTNEDAAYTRNRIRLKLIPFLEREFNPNIIDSLVRMANILNDDNEYLKECVREAYEQVVHITDGIAVVAAEKFAVLHKAIQRRISRSIIYAIKGDINGIEFFHIEQLTEYINTSRAGQKLVLPFDILAERSGDNVYVCTRLKMAHMAEPFCHELAIPGDTYIKNGQAVVTSCIIDKNSVTDYNSSVFEAYMDIDKISLPLCVRNRRDGDRFFPIGSAGHKKLKEYFIDEKIPRVYRDAIPLVASDHEVLWVIGHRLSDICKVDDSTKKVLKLTYREW